MEYVKYDPIENAFIKDENSKGVLLPQIIWHITTKCKLKCPYCFADKGAEAQNIDINQYINLLKKLGVLKIDISGGEPLLSNKLDLICRELYKEKFYLTITTTGCGTEDNFNWLVENKELFARIIFSIDGTRKLHNDLRGRIGLFDDEVKKINQFKDVSKEKIRINTVVTRKLLDDNIDELIQSIENIGPREWCLIEVHPANNKSYNDERVSYEEYEALVKYISKKTKLKIITRKQLAYSYYWSINADGTISRHSETKEDLYKRKIDECSFEDIKYAICNNKQEYPKEEKMNIKIENTNNSELVSELLSTINQICEQKDYEVSVQKTSLDNKKCDIVQAIIINLASDALWAIVIYAINRLKNRPDFNEDEEITINGEVKNIGNIEDKGDK